MSDYPHSQGPEKSVLSSLLKAPEMMVRALAEGICENWFHIPAHCILFRELRRKHAAAEEIELVTLVEDLHRRGDLDSIGGAAAITDVFTYAPNAAHFVQHMERLRWDAARRLAIRDAQRLVEEAPDMSPGELTAALSRALDGTVKALKHGPSGISAKQAVELLTAQLLALQSQDAAVPGLATGLLPVDLVTGGIWPFELWVIAADTSCGKSVVLLQAALEALQNGKRVLIISLEMNAATIAGRMISNLKSISNDVWRKPKMAKKVELERVKTGMDAFSKFPLTIDDEGGRTLDDVYALAQSEIDRHGSLDLIVVDYLQRMKVTSQRGRNREQEVAELSAGLKSIAMKLKVPIFTASQVTKDGKGGVRLRDSGAIGFDADVVLRVTDEGIVGDKVRNGQRDQTFPLVLNGEFQRFDRVHQTAEQSQFHDDV